jgi:hypothetical protein
VSREVRQAATLLATCLPISTRHGWAGSIRRPVEVRVLLARVTCQLTRSWCGRAASIAEYLSVVPARRTAQR